MAWVVVGMMMLAACGDSGSEEGGAGGSGGDPGGTGGGSAGAEPGLEPDAQTPPQSGADVDAWIAQGDYQAWSCETAEHAARSPSPHGVNRICSNQLLSAHGTGEYPVGAASVKEIFDAEGGDIVGYAVALHVSEGTDGGSWYWYEKIPGMGVVADGLGDTGPANTICVGCHQGAGIDAMHSGHDMVYTQVE